MSTEEFLNKIDAIESPIKGGFSSANGVINKYVTPTIDMQAIAAWIPRNNIYSLYTKDNNECDVVAGYLTFGAIGYIISNNAYSRNERNNVVFNFNLK